MKKNVTRFLLSVLCGAWLAPPGMAQPLAFQDSPFGIFGPYVSLTAENPLTSVSKSDVNNHLNNLGVKWVEEMPVEDSIDKLSSETAVNIYSRVGCMGKTPPYTSDQKCKDSIRSTIKQYKNKIKYWEFGTEPNGIAPPVAWKGYGKEYATDLKEAYTIIKQECPDCYVVFGGLTGQGVGTAEIPGGPADFLKDALGGGAGDYFDVFEFKQHGANADDYKEIGNRLTIYSKIFSANGLDLRKQKLIFLETATHDGCPTSNPEQKCQTQARQAAGLLKYYVYSMSQGVDKIFWNLIYERHNFGVPPAPPGSSPFDYYGLVNNPDNDGDSSKKLAYYTYKKMVESLEGADWSNIQTVRESDNVYVYKFTRNGAPVYVAWWDYFNDPTYTPGKTTPVTVTGFTGNTALVTEAVPPFSSGAGVTNYTTAFRQQTLAVTGGTVTLQLGESPVFVEGPAVSLRVNGSSNVTVTVSNPVTVDYTIRGGQGQEFFLVLDAPAMNIPLSYRNATSQWVSLPANLANVTPFSTAPADGDYRLYTGTAPAGAYSLCLGYDTVSNGRLNLDAAVYDCVEATVR